MSIEKIEGILPSGKSCEKVIDWGNIEKSLKINFPDDYKVFVEKYGVGWIDDFLLVLTPHAKNERYNIVPSSEMWLSNYQSAKDSFPQYYKHEVYDGKKGIFPWGITDNADVLYWLFEGNQVKEIVVYNARGGDFYSSPLCFSEFLYQLLSKKTVCDRFPDDFPSETIEFVVDED